MKNKQQMAIAARKLYIENPKNARIDDQNNVWYYDDEDSQWISITGECVAKMPGRDYISDFNEEVDEYRKVTKHFRNILSRYENATMYEKIEIASYAYWDVSELHKTQLYEFCGVRNCNEFKKLIKNPIVKIKCPSCKEVREITVTTFTHMQEIRKHKFLEECDDCRRISWDKSDKEHEERDIAIENRRNELINMSYPEYLQSDEWQEIRKRRLRQAHYKCELCGAKNVELHVHHNTYTERGCESRNDLTVLCKDCHKKHHNIEDIEEDDIDLEGMLHN